MAKKKKVVLPSPSNPPEGIAKKAKELWPKFWRKYGSTVKKAGKKDPETMWAVALAIFRNFCLKRNVPPFEKKRDKETKEAIVQQIETALNNTSRAIKTIARALIKKGFVSPQRGENITISFDRKEGKTEIVLTSTFRVKDLNRKNFVALMDRFGLKKKGNGFVKKLSAMSFVTVLPPKSWNRRNSAIQINRHIVINNAHVVALGGETKVKGKKIEQFIRKNIVKKFIKPIKRKELSLLAEANYSEDLLLFDFDPLKEDPNRPLTKEELDSIESFRKRIEPLSPEEIDNNFNLGFIRGLGDYAYRIAVIKMIIDVLKSKGASVYPWEEILNDSAYLLSDQGMKYFEQLEINEPMYQVVPTWGG